MVEISQAEFTRQLDSIQVGEWRRFCVGGCDIYCHDDSSPHVIPSREMFLVESLFYRHLWFSEDCFGHYRVKTRKLFVLNVGFPIDHTIRIRDYHTAIIGKDRYAVYDGAELTEYNRDRFEIATDHAVTSVLLLIDRNRELEEAASKCAII